MGRNLRCMNRSMGFGLVLVLAACGAEEVIAPPPPPPFAVSFSTSTSSAAWNAETQRYECRYEITARATGGEVGSKGFWLASEWQFRFPDGTNRTYFLDADDMLDHFGSSDLRTGETQQANRVAWSPVSLFNLFYTLRWIEPDGSARSEGLLVSCGG
jgi:hypothetical protein